MSRGQKDSTSEPLFILGNDAVLSISSICTAAESPYDIPEGVLFSRTAIEPHPRNSRQDFQDEPERI